MKYFQLILALLLVICLFHMPYGYYTLVRFLAMTIFAYLSFSYYEIERKATPLVFTFGALALLFQPFFKVALGRSVWNIIDVVVAILLVVSFISNYKSNK